MMGDMCDIRATLTRMALDLTVASLVGLLLVPFFGPMLDHHFAERRPDHAHIYLGAVVHDHVHPYEVSMHDHFHTDGHESGGSLSENALPDGIVFLTSHDGAATGFIELTVPASRESAVFPDPEEYRTALRIPGSTTIPQSVVASSPWRPPRA